MRTIPKFIEGKKTLIHPFEKNGTPTLPTSILATLLHNKPLTRDKILSTLGEEHTGRSRGYLSNYFNDLSKSGIIQYSKNEKVWRQGVNYNEYMGFVFMELLNLDEQAVSSFQYRLLPKHDSQAVDFIRSPEEDIFNQPNPYLD